MNKENIINLKGKDFITFKGLLELAHEQGLSNISTELISIDKDTTKEEGLSKTIVTQATGLVIFKATVTGKKGTYEAYGDASPKSVLSNAIRPHIIRMAETRAIARALRWYTGFGYTSSIELAED